MTRQRPVGFNQTIATVKYNQIVLQFSETMANLAYHSAQRFD